MCIAVELVSQKELDTFVEESLKMKEFKHLNVIHLHGICLDDPTSPMIIMPFMENGCLLHYLRGRRQEGVENTQREYSVRVGYGIYKALFTDR